MSNRTGRLLPIDTWMAVGTFPKGFTAIVNGNFFVKQWLCRICESPLLASSPEGEIIEYLESFKLEMPLPSSSSLLFFRECHSVSRQRSEILMSERVVWMFHICTNHARKFNGNWPYNKARRSETWIRPLPRSLNYGWEYFDQHSRNTRDALATNCKDPW